MKFREIWHKLCTRIGLGNRTAATDAGSIAPHGRRILHSWYVPAAMGSVLLVTLILWASPRRVEKVIATETLHEWEGGTAPARRQIVWDTPLLIEDLLPNVDGEAHLLTPRLADAGTTLYFTLRIDEGPADIFRSRLVDGRWQAAAAVGELNSSHDDIGPTLSPDGRWLSFYSNRPGGAGGFDLYLTERAGQAWGSPKNMGPAVNSPADEYDPALHSAADRLSLFFASNRVASPDRAPSEGGTANSSKPPAWSATLRAHDKSARFDLLVSRRTSADSDWSEPAPLSGLNSPTSNEGAPFVTAAGTYLYFASDRPARRGEKRNLDLYRARINGERFGPVENLGPGINTPATETEPALSGEGQTLVFSSNREGLDGVYRSQAQEVIVERVWDSARWQAFMGIWWSALLLALLAAAAAAMLWYAYRWMAEKASAARFLAASIAFHGLLVLLMWKTPLGMAVVKIVEEIKTNAEALQMFDDNLHQSHTAGTEAYEKVADLKSLQATDEPEALRQVKELPNVPVPPENRNLVPTVPVQVARALPANRVLFVPPPDVPLVRQPSELKRQSLPPIQLAALDPEPMELPAGAAAPAEAPVDRKAVDVERDAAAAPANLELPRRTAAPLANRMPIAELDLVEQPEAPEIKGPTVAPNTALRGPIPQKSPAAEDLASIELAAAVKPVEDAPLVAAAALLARIDPSEVAPLAQPAGAAKQTPPPRLVPRPDRLPDKPIELPAETPSPRPEQDRANKQPAPVNRLESASKLPEQAAPAESQTTPQAAPTEQPLARETVIIERPDALRVEVEVRVPRELSGARTTFKPRLIVGTLSDESVEAPPSLSPLANTLTRAPAKATPVAYAEDNVGLQAMFTLRQGDNRRQFIELFGGNEATEAAVNRGLKWLAAHQDPAGSWSLNNFHANCKGKHADCAGAGATKSDVAATGLALLPFLAAGHTTQEGEYRAVVVKGFEWLISKQKPDGQLLADGDAQPMYSHGLASIALCEVFGMTKDEKLKGPAQRALQFIEKAQHAPSGGWRYGPNQSGDTSVVGWQVMALKSGEMAGLSVPPAVLEGARRWLASVESNQPAGGLFGYVSPGATPAMTAEGMLCLEFLGVRRNDPRMRAAADYLLKNLPEQNNASSTSYYWYYATQAMYHMQGDYWTAWNDKLRDSVVATQVLQGDIAGTWAPRDPWENSGGRVFATSLRLLMLEVYYRHLPLYQQLDD